eukprot:Skav217277  [mRNA]  locus=scaffold120:185464:192649:+ [translate_table: standard]
MGVKVKSELSAQIEALPGWSMDDVSKLLFALAKVKVADSPEMAELYGRAAEALRQFGISRSDERHSARQSQLMSLWRKDAVRRELAAEAAHAQIAKALEAKDALVAQARANAACALAAVHEGTKRDAERHAMELALAKRNLEEAKQQSNARLQAAELTRLKAREEGQARVQAAEQRKQHAIDTAKKVAAESNALCQARIEDAHRRIDEVETLVRQQVADAEERQSSQLREAEDRAAHVEKEAQLRAEATKSAAAAILEKQVKELQLWVSQTEDEFLRTQQRLEVEQVKAQKMIGRIYGMAEDFQHRGELCERQAEDMRVESGQEVNQMIADYHHWRAQEMEYLACQADGLQGLEDFVARLRMEVPMRND